MSSAERGALGGPGGESAGGGSFYGGGGRGSSFYGGGGGGDSGSAIGDSASVVAGNAGGAGLRFGDGAAGAAGPAGYEEGEGAGTAEGAGGEEEEAALSAPLDTNTQLQLIFQYYCRFGRTGGSGDEQDTLDGANFAKLTRECPDLLDRVLNPTGACVRCCTGCCGLLKGVLLRCGCGVAAGCKGFCCCRGWSCRSRIAR